ncbi:hypothetical protein [Phaffia rhodozyma]|uniref:Uncharacterized protein n=1 Tax=Phaffia rhodozyma TaxID=264483 RepID=A0A0F7SSR9_PHARH|nr:hypothetical protein [Phaffia rhodozyma]
MPSTATLSYIPVHMPDLQTSSATTKFHSHTSLSNSATLYPPLQSTSPSTSPTDRTDTGHIRWTTDHQLEDGERYGRFTLKQNASGLANPASERSGSCDSGRTELSSTTGSSNSSDTSITSTTSTAPSLASPASSIVQLKTTISPNLTNGQEPLSPSGKDKDLKTLRRSSSGFGMFKGWFSGSSAGPKKVKEKGKPSGGKTSLQEGCLVMQTSGATGASQSSEFPPPSSSSVLPELVFPSPAFMGQAGRRFLSDSPSPGGSPTGSPSFPPISLPSIPNIPSSSPSQSCPVRQDFGSSQSSIQQQQQQPPTLTPLQSLHLLSSQKLSLLLRPPSPHPFFMSRLNPASGKDGETRRYPASTNPVTAQSTPRRRVVGLTAEVGVRGLMHRLETDARLSADEMEALIRLSQARPVSLQRDKSGRLIASISPTSDASVSTAEFAATSAVPRANLPLAGSGILAFISRPTLEVRSIVLVPAANDPDRIIVEPILPARGLAVMELEFSEGMEAYAREVIKKSSASFEVNVPGTRHSTSGTTLPSLVNSLVGRRSPTDPSPADGLKVVIDRVPTVRETVLPGIKLRRSSSTPSSPIKANASSEPVNEFLSPTMNNVPHASKLKSSLSSSSLGLQKQQQQQQLAIPRSALSKPRRSMSSMNLVTRRSFPPPVGSQFAESALEDDDKEDETPLSEIQRRHSTIALTPVPSQSTRARDRVRFAQVDVMEDDRSCKEDLGKDLDRQGEAPWMDSQAEIRAREDAEWEALERDRLRADEEERRRQERYRAEVAAARERRDLAKLGSKKGNNGNYEEWGALSARVATSSRTTRSESLRTLGENSASPMDTNQPAARRGDRSSRVFAPVELSIHPDRSRQNALEISPSTSNSTTPSHSPQSGSPPSSSPRSSILSSARPSPVSTNSGGISKRHSTAAITPSPLSSSIENQPVRGSQQKSALSSPGAQPPVALSTSAPSRPSSGHHSSLSLQIPPPYASSPMMVHSYSTPSLAGNTHYTHQPAYSPVLTSPPTTYYHPHHLHHVPQPQYYPQPAYSVQGYPFSTHYTQFGFPNQHQGFSPLMTPQYIQPHQAAYQQPIHIQPQPHMGSRSSRANLRPTPGSSRQER